MNIPPPKRNRVAIGPYRLSMAQAGRGPSMVLLHGIPTHGFLWREVAPRPVEAGFEVTVFDLLGYGHSDKPVDADLGIAAQAMPNARLEIVADAGHFLPEGAPILLPEFITTFTTPSQGA